MNSKINRSDRSTTIRRKKYSAPALEKGLDILELLSGEDRGLNISELAKKLGRSVGEVFRMMAVLEQRGYIRLRDDSDAYVLTLKLFQLSHRLAPVARLSAAALPVMKILAGESNQSCHIVIQYAGRGHVVGQQDPPTDRIFGVRLGAEAPLLDSCSGHVILAFADEEVRQAMIRKIPRPERTPDAEEVQRLVRRVRKKGYERLSSGQVRGVTDIGYPIFDHSGQVVAALVVPFVAFLQASQLVPMEKVSELTGAAAGKISSALGFVADERS